MPDGKNLARAIFAAAASPELKNVTKDVAQGVIDGSLGADALGGIPAVSSMLALVDSVGRVRDAFLTRKLLAFTLGVADADEAARDEFFRKHCATDKQKRRLCDLVLQVLDDLREQERVTLVAGLFVGLLDGRVTEKDFSALCDVTTRITRKHVGLLQRIRAKAPLLVVDPEVTFLAVHGLAYIDYTPHADGHGLRYGATPTGEVLLNVVAELPW